MPRIDEVGTVPRKDLHIFYVLDTSGDDDRRQIEISSQKLHHNNALLSARFEKFFT